MRFRLGRASDIAACVALVREEECFQASASVWGALESIWGRLVRADAALFAVWEDTPLSQKGPRLHGFGLNAFVRQSVASDWHERPRPYQVATLYERWLAGESVMLEGDEIALANASVGLDLAVLHCVFTPRHAGSSTLRDLVPVMADAWAFCHSGYRISRVLHEAYGPDHAEMVMTAGLRVVTAFDGHAALAGVAPERRPTLLGVELGDQRHHSVQLARMGLADPPPPRFGFTRAQQRLLLHALMGESDRRIAGLLHVADDTVKKTWDAIFRRVADAAPALLQPDATDTRVTDADAQPRRGPEKRRILLAYLRGHMQELRPWRTP